MTPREQELLQTAIPRWRQAARVAAVETRGVKWLTEIGTDGCVNVVPVDGRLHVFDDICWCCPLLDSITGLPVLLHRMEH